MRGPLSASLNSLRDIVQTSHDLFLTEIGDCVYLKESSNAVTEMQELPGQRQGTKKYFYEGHFYHIDPRQPNYGDTYICSYRYTQWQCPAIAQTTLNGAVTVRKKHCHPPTLLEENQRLEEFKKKLKERGRESLDSPDAIYKSVRKEYADVAHLILQTSAKMHIIRERNKLRPKLPENFTDLGEILRQYEPATGIYQGQVVVSDTSSGVIFASSEMINRLNECSEIYVDGTFKCVPKGVGAKQLLILHIKKMNVGMASVFVLCSNQTTELYVSIWNFLLERAPGLRKSLKCVMMDFERALIKSVKLSMPWVIIRGCWFHFTKAISSHWQDLGLKNVLSTNVQDILSLAWVLPLLPAKDFGTAIKFYRKKADHIESEHKEPIREFIDYLENQWLRIAEIVSLWRSPTRTNNVCESFHGRLLKRLGHHPNLYVFIGKLVEVITDIETNWRHLEVDGNAMGSRRFKQSIIDSYIHAQQIALLHGKIDVPEFLMKMKTKNIKKFIQLRLYSPHYMVEHDSRSMLGPQELHHLLNYPPFEPVCYTEAESHQLLQNEESPGTQELETIQEPVPDQSLKEAVATEELEIIQIPKVTQPLKVTLEPGFLREELDSKDEMIIVIELEAEPDTEEKPQIMKEPIVLLERLKPEQIPVVKQKKPCCLGCSVDFPYKKPKKKRYTRHAESKVTINRVNSDIN